MRNVDDLLDAAKAKTGSDNKTAKAIDIPNQLIGNWRGRRSMPSNKHIMAMCQNWGIDLAEAVLAVEYSRENERPLKEAGFATTWMMITLAAFTSMILVAVSHPAATLELARIAHANTVYYVKLYLQLRRLLERLLMHYLYLPLGAELILVKIRPVIPF